MDIGKTLAKRRETLRGPRENFDTIYEDVSKYIVPSRREILSRHTPGRRRTDSLFDSTAPDACALAAAAAHGSMTPETFKWFAPELDDPELAAITGVDDWSYRVSDVMFRTINASNFHAEGQEIWYDLFAYATGCGYLEEDDEELDPSGRFNGVRFFSFQPGTYVISESPRGIVNTIFRDFSLSLNAVVARFGESSLSDGLRKKYANERTKYESVDLCHAVMPAEDYPEKSKGPFVSVYFECEKGNVLRRRDVDAFPYFVPRWTKASGEVYGRGPGINALPNIRTLNRVVELMLRNAAKVVDPPLEVLNRNVIGDISLAPASWNSVKQLNSIRTMDLAGRFDLTQLQLEDLRGAIRRAFLVDQIQFPPMQGTPASATEIVTRMELMRRILGPVYGRVLNEWHTVMLSLVYRMMAERGALPDPPTELLRKTGGSAVNIRFRFENALTRAQSLVDVEAVTRAIAIISQYISVFPEVADYADMREAGKFILEASRVPAILIRSDAEANVVRDARTEAADAALQQAQTETISEAIRNVAPVVGGV